MCSYKIVMNPGQFKTEAWYILHIETVYTGSQYTVPINNVFAKKIQFK